MAVAAIQTLDMAHGRIFAILLLPCGLAQGPFGSRLMASGASGGHLHSNDHVPWRTHNQAADQAASTCIDFLWRRNSPRRDDIAKATTWSTHAIDSLARAGQLLRTHLLTPAEQAEFDEQ